MEQPALRFAPCREDAHGSKDVCSTVTEIPSFLSRWTQADALINIIPDAALIASGSQNIVEDRFAPCASSRHGAKRSAGYSITGEVDQISVQINTGAYVIIRTRRKDRKNVDSSRHRATAS
ncbi:hypothetical protein ACQ4WQ_10905 [Janthinobacterium sp. GB1R12]|uniref:hypothetical protein n=1 Tax=Janthinobacterium sp. GB1R12 TaxID=3424190 RepID=UPI003F22C04F